MKSWKSKIFEAESEYQKYLRKEVEKRDFGSSALKGKGKSPKKVKQKDPDQPTQRDWFNQKQERIELQKRQEISKKKRNIEKEKEKRVSEFKGKAASALKGIQTQQISKDDKEGTAYKKLVGNVGSAAGGLASAAYYGARALVASRKKVEEPQSKQTDPKEPGKPGRPKAQQPAKAPRPSAGPSRPALPAAPERPALPGAGKPKMLPPSGGLTRGPKAQTLGQRARQNPKIKAGLIAQREEYSNWREELIIEKNLIIEVGDRITADKSSDKNKKKRIIDITSETNTIKINPEIGDYYGYNESYEYETVDEECGCEGNKKKDLVMALIKKMVDTKKKKNFQLNSGIIGESSPAWQRKEGKNPEGGLNKKGIASYRKQNPGSKLSLAVTTPPSKLDPDSKAAKRRKSFCARMGGMPGPMKDEKGRPTRKALSLRKWNC